MPTGTLQINNKTDFTPTLETITLIGCQWLHTQELTDGQAIAPHGVAQGTVELHSIDFSAYSIGVEVKYYTLGPGPKSGGGSVHFICGRENVGDNLMAFMGDNGSTPHVNIDYRHIVAEGTNDIFILDISPN